ncbi:c-type cytochrome [Candidatus Thiosymbion oneisti]|nr:c-type cytochrome [Candidatus Thiosymbion oneisti]
MLLLVYLQSHRSASFETAVEMGEQLAQQGREDIPACTGCHGGSGEGNRGLGYPRLAGLHPDYIRKQLRDFARNPLDIGVKVDAIARDYTKTPRIYKDLTVYSPGIRSDAIMNPIAKALTPEEIDNLSEYYARLPFKARPVAADFQTLENGRELAARGKPEYMMPRCSACHGPNGEGFGAIFPPLSGQPPQYIINQINKWQRGERDNDNLAIMKNISNLLTDGDKKTIAAYFDNMSYEVNQ